MDQWVQPVLCKGLDLLEGPLVVILSQNPLQSFRKPIFSGGLRPQQRAPERLGDPEDVKEPLEVEDDVMLRQCSFQFLRLFSCVCNLSM